MKYHSGVQSKKTEMGRACSTYRGKERCIQDFGGETRRKELLGRPRREWEGTIKMNICEVECGGWGMDWIDLGQDRDRWRAVVNVVINFRVL